MDPSALRPNIERLHSANPEGSVVILADDRSFNDTLVQVMDAARQVRIYDIALAAKPRSR